MNSSLVAGIPAIGASRRARRRRVPTDWKGKAMQRRIRRRYAAERNFRLLGLGAVLLSAGFLAFLLISMIGTGAGGFSQTELKLRDRLPQILAVLDPAVLAGPGKEPRWPPPTSRARPPRRPTRLSAKARRLLSDGAWLKVRDAIAANPAILSHTATIRVPAEHRHRSRRQGRRSARGRGRLRPAEASRRHAAPASTSLS